MRENLRAAVQRDLRRSAAPRTLAPIEAELAPDEPVDAVTETSRRGLLVVTDRRLLLAERGGEVQAMRFDAMRDVVPLPLDDRAFVAPLIANQAFDGITVPRQEARRIAGAAHNRIVELLESSPTHRWHDDPVFTIATRFAPVLLLVSPPEYPLPTQTLVSLSVVTTGIQITPVKPTSRLAKQFIPWDFVKRLDAEGVDQVTQRPRVGAVLAFGVLGLAASRKEKRGYVAVSTDTGDFIFQVDGLLPTEIRAHLVPAIERLGSSPVTTDHPDHNGDPLEQIRRLAELRDAGAISAEEFETKKTELLGRI